MKPRLPNKRHNEKGAESKGRKCTPTIIIHQLYTHTLLTPAHVCCCLLTSPLPVPFLFLLLSWSASFLPVRALCKCACAMPMEVTTRVTQRKTQVTVRHKIRGGEMVYCACGVCGHESIRVECRSSGVCIGVKIRPRLDSTRPHRRTHIYLSLTFYKTQTYPYFQTYTVSFTHTCLGHNVSRSYQCE